MNTSQNILENIKNKKNDKTDMFLYNCERESRLM